MTTTTRFDVRTTDLRKLNSMTKYPSIFTYHTLDPKNGNLLDETMPFVGPVIGTEKIDGCNGRIILLPDHSYLIASREELLYAEGDLIVNPELGIVNTLRPVAEDIPRATDSITVLYVEVYGGKTTQAGKQYSTGGQLGCRLFDTVVLPYDTVTDMLEWKIERIASWRDHGGQRYLNEQDLTEMAQNTGLELVPRLFTMDAATLPTGIEETQAFLLERVPTTTVALGDAKPGKAEGIVLRSADRSVIAKARLEDYQRTLRRRSQGRN
jgi:hypothetical protein